ncbi:MAG: putative bifunctional diguanylate cyclase/phosphodiesterase [Pyrinomonadaceae bacterium]
MDRSKRTNAYMALVILSGFACLAAAVRAVPTAKLDIEFLLVAVLTICASSRVSVRIPSLKSHISVSDTFIFLTLLLYGGEFAILLAAADAFVSSWRFCSRKVTVLFNTAAMAASTSLVYAVLLAAGFYTEDKLHGHRGSVGDFIIAMSLIAMTQFAANTTLAALHEAIKTATRFGTVWQSKYLWTFLSYSIGAAGAGVLVQLFDRIGFWAILASFPVILFVFLTYRMYLQNVEMSLKQAEQAEQYARVLEEQSAALQESEERFRSAFDHAPIGIALVSVDNRWLKVNEALCSILGYTEDELLERDVESVVYDDDLRQVTRMLAEVKSGNAESHQNESRFVHKRGRTVWTSWSVSSAQGGKLDGRHLILQVQNITDRKHAEERLQYEATHDALTGLANRSLLMCRLDEAVVHSQMDQRYRVSLLFIDLDRFKNVNDSLGHLYGDRLLIEISQRLRECMRPGDMIARIGGDEFVILIEGHHADDEVVSIAERVHERFTVPFALGQHEVYSSASIGILHANEHHRSGEEMMRDADTAMYHAKRSGRARHEVFDIRMHKAANETLRLETMLRRAVENREFTVWYQPIFDLANRRLSGVEALARWHDDILGEVPPTRFIPIAEEIGLIEMLGEFIIRQACTDFASVKSSSAEFADLSLSVNLSCRQFANPNLVERISRLLAETSFPPSCLKLEITESVFIEHQERAIRMLHQLRETGIEFNVDDFGTGYSNLSYLAELPISCLKIDRSFVSLLDQRGAKSALVHTIVALARNLGLRVVAEGIETGRQLDEISRLDCDYGQGFLLAPPMRAEDLRDLLVSSQGRLMNMDGWHAARLDEIAMLSTLQ